MDEILRNFYSLVMCSKVFGRPGKGSPKLGKLMYYVQEYKNPQNPGTQKSQYNFFSKTKYQKFSWYPLTYVEPDR